MNRWIAFVSASFFMASAAFAADPQPVEKKADEKKAEAKKVDVGTQAPAFKIKDASGKPIFALSN